MKALYWLFIFIYSLIPAGIAYVSGGEQSLIGQLYVAAIVVMLIFWAIKNKIATRKEEY